ncbi:MAG: YdeI/OmpD-associated family protein [Acidobacteriota bacterium]|nr:YdeI/OmpD-associated family protein [Acidobacteriota bacterium]
MSRSPDLPGRQVTPRNERTWRRWLEANHAAVPEVWVVFYKKHALRPGRPTLTYGQAVEQAICFGWIDGLKRRIDDERYTHRFTPRKPDSRWSESNRERLARMRSQGLMAPPGEASVEASIRSGAWDKPARAAPVEAPAELLAALESDTDARAGWATQTRAQQRRYEVWIGMAKRDETRARRLAESLAKLRRGEKLGMR